MRLLSAHVCTRSPGSCGACRYHRMEGRCSALRWRGKRHNGAFLASVLSGRPSKRGDCDRVQWERDAPLISDITRHDWADRPRVEHNGKASDWPASAPMSGVIASILVPTTREDGGDRTNASLGNLGDVVGADLGAKERVLRKAALRAHLA